MCECHQPQAVAPAGLSCICHVSWRAKASSVYMCKSQILLLGMSQASLDTLLRWWCQGPAGVCLLNSTELVDARLGMAGKGSHSPLPAFHPTRSHLQQHGRHWRLEFTARKFSLARLHWVSFLPLHPTGTSWLSVGQSNPEQAPSHLQRV